jgi:hypothetical protein
VRASSLQNDVAEGGWVTKIQAEKLAIRAERLGRSPAPLNDGFNSGPLL